jgi:transposase-like protein
MGAEPVGPARPAELDLTLTDQAKFVICNHTIEQDHRGVKRITRPMLGWLRGCAAGQPKVTAAGMLGHPAYLLSSYLEGFKSFDAVQLTLVGIELMHMIKKKQMVVEEGNEGRTAAEQFYALAA